MPVSPCSLSWCLFTLFSRYFSPGWVGEGGGHSQAWDGLTECQQQQWYEGQREKTQKVGEKVPSAQENETKLWSSQWVRLALNVRMCTYVPQKLHYSVDLSCFCGNYELANQFPRLSTAYFLCLLTPFYFRNIYVLSVSFPSCWFVQESLAYRTS